MGHEHHKDIPVKAAVITVSTSRTEKTDLSGQIIREAFENAEMEVVFQTLVPDVEEQISSAVSKAL
ncbi:MAG TPA: molybdopterin-binding protein, partial [Methanocorpusculum sp.]|nr:molybdopterin-binding protein [Methanocorpusculum sp.]